MTNMFTLFLLIGVLAVASAQQLCGMAPQGTQASGLSSTRQRISDKLSELGNKLGGMCTDTAMKAAGVPKQVRLIKMNYFFPKRTKGLASTREEREQLLRTVAATEYTISGTSSNLSVELFHPTAAGTTRTVDC